MKIIDISRTAQEAPLYPGSTPISIERVADMSRGAPFNASMVTALSHIGTHADAFTHFLQNETASIDKIDLEYYYGDCRVVSVPSDSMITKADLAGKIDGCTRLVIHGGGMSYLEMEAADYIVQSGIRTVVTDAWSVAPLGNESAIHQALMSKGIAIVENVVLDGVPDGDYTLCAFPIKYGGCDGAPVRAVLLK